MKRGMVAVARRIQRGARGVLPDTVARLTWAYRRREGDALLGLVEQLVRRGDAVVDIGANWGLYSGRLARLVGPAGRVDAFEPHPGHAPTLLALSRRYPQLHVHSLGLSDSRGSETLYVPVIDDRPVTALSTFRRPAPEQAHEALVVDVDTLDRTLGGARPALIKCDVEGAELNVLRGAQETLRRSLPILVVEIEQRHTTTPITETFSFLEALGYEGYFHEGGALRPLSEFDLERHQLAFVDGGPVAYEMPAGYTGNFIFAPPDSRLEGGA